MALGLFIAVLPFMGLQLPIALGAALALRRFGLHLSPVSAAGGVWLTNPLTAVPVYTVTYLLGRPLARLLVSDGSADGVDSHLTNAVDVGASALPVFAPFAWQTALALLIGGVMVGIPLAWVGFRITLRAVHRHRQRIQERRIRRRRTPRPTMEAPRAGAGGLVPIAAMAPQPRAPTP